MKRLLFTLFFITILNAGCKQKVVEKEPKTVVNITEDTATEIPLFDTSISRTFSDTSILRYGEFASSKISIELGPEPLGWTSDYEGIFTNEQILVLDSIIGRFEKETSIEFAVLTIDSTYATRENFDEFTLAIAKKWGVGKKHKNNGILIGISVGLKEIRIQNGIGIEAKLSDDATKIVIQKFMLPEFRRGNYFEGTKKGLLVLMEKVRG
jgi:uncharacterized protein